MKRLNRRHILSLMGATAFSGCAPAISTTQLGDDPFEGGIGGTGIVGLMTGTGSVLVNGLRIEIPNSARILANGLTASDALLLPGTALSLVANTRRGRFEAQQIDIDTPLIGTLTRTSQGYAVNGTKVRVEGVASLVGHHVVAHGLWQPDGSLRSSLVQSAQSGPSSIAGVAINDPNKGWRIGQTRLALPEGGTLIAGQFAVASGRYANGVLSVTSIELGRFRGGQAVRQLSIEGYLEPIDAAPGYQISGLGHSFDQRLALNPFAQLRALYFGPYDGRFRARRAVVLPDSQEPRRALLRPAEGENFAQSLTGTAAKPIATQ